MSAMRAIADEGGVRRASPEAREQLVEAEFVGTETLAEMPNAT